MNDKIEKISTNIQTRVEDRNDIDMIIKSFDAITICIIEKEIILRLTNSSIKIINLRRSRGISFEPVKGVMARLSLFDGVDATLYSGTKYIGPDSDHVTEEVALPSFAVAMTGEEIDQRYDERRRRREERESGRFSTSLRGKVSVPSTSTSSTKKSSVVKNEKMNIVSSSIRQLEIEKSEQLVSQISDMKMDSSAEDSNDEEEIDAEDLERHQKIAKAADSNAEGNYTFKELLTYNF